ICNFRTDLARSDFVVEISVVHGFPMKMPAFQTVDAAVSDVCNRGAVPGDMDQRHSGRHGFISGIAFRKFKDISIGEVDGSTNKLHGFAVGYVGGVVSQRFFDGFGCGLAGDFAGSLPAYAVKNGEKSALGNRQVSVLVYRSLGTQSAVADIADFEIHSLL